MPMYFIIPKADVLRLQDVKGGDAARVKLLTKWGVQLVGRHGVSLQEQALVDAILNGSEAGQAGTGLQVGSVHLGQDLGPPISCRVAVTFMELPIAYMKTQTCLPWLSLS